jgi:hypothetical protein
MPPPGIRLHFLSFSNNRLYQGPAILALPTPVTFSRNFDLTCIQARAGQSMICPDVSVNLVLTSPRLLIIG